MHQPGFCIALLSAATTTAAAQNFKLGVNYSVPISAGSMTLITNVAAATDSEGDIYVLLTNYITQPGSTLVKVNPAGKVVRQTALAFYAPVMAADATGNLYLAETGLVDGTNFVDKLSGDGATLVYRTPIGGQIPAGIAVDSTGRAYVTGQADPNDFQPTPGAFQTTATNGNSTNGFVVRLKADGAIDYATYLGGGVPAGIAVDAAGSAFVTGTAYSPGFPVTPGAYRTSGESFVTRLTSDGSGLIYSTFAGDGSACCIALDSADDAVVASQSPTGTGFEVVSMNPEGTGASFSRTLPASLPAALATDEASNIYVLSAGVNANYPVKNSVAPCGAGPGSALTVLDQSGDVLQATYVAAPTGTSTSAPAVGTGALPALTLAAGSMVNVVSVSITAPPFLAQLSPNAQAQIVPLACLGNGANYDNSAISGGEIVSLFGEGLGPATGTQPQVTMQTGFPTKLADVQVTFNGIPGPLLYVQDSQINAIAPWSLEAGQTADICVTYNGAATNCITRPAVQTHPGVFTVDGYHAAAVNQDGTINTTASPAPVGSIVSVFATGLGPIEPPQQDGAIIGFPLPSNVVPVTMASVERGLPIFGGPQIIPITVEYAGPAPYQVAGVGQINFVANGSGFPVFVYSGAGACSFWIYQ